MTAALPTRLTALLPAIDVAIDAATRRLGSELVAIDTALAPAADALRDASRGGKRLRPALVGWSFTVHGGGDPTRVLGAAVALEMVHTCALVHDDVFDQANERRGVATVHSRFAAEHARGWAGDPAAYGRATAILLGDVALAAADAELLTAEVGSEPLRRAHGAFTRLRVEVMAGQFLDVDAAARRDADRERALRVATLKSARYSVARPLELGALLAGADDTAAARMLAVGDPIGRAFQLRDDLLGSFGDPARTGKPTGLDLTEGKRTLLVAEALQRLDDSGAAELEASLGDSELDAARAEQLCKLIDACGAREAVEAQLATEIASAAVAIESCGLDEAAQADLRELATWATERES